MIPILYFRLINQPSGRWDICLKTETSLWLRGVQATYIYGNSKSSFLNYNVLFHFKIHRQVLIMTGTCVNHNSYFTRTQSLKYFSSEYPAQRSKKGSDDMDVGVAGSVNLLQNATLSTQPIASLDWSPDKQGLCVCSGFDQSVRVLIVTKLNVVW